jgi:hypothetical protein
MTFPKARLAVAFCLFVGWLGFLGLLVFQSRNLVVLSRPQFLIAQMYVVVEVRDDRGKPDPDVIIEEVLWVAEPVDAALTKLQLVDLPECDPAHGYRGAGKYLLPLVKSKEPRFQIARIPQGAHEKRIYPWTPDARAQVDQLIAAK